MPIQDKLAKEDFLNKLEELTTDLYYISESDEPLEVVNYERISGADLEPNQVSSLIGISNESQAEVTDLAYFFRNMTAGPAPGDEAGLESANRFRALQAYLESNLQDVKVYRFGNVEISAFILGKFDETTIAGLKTKVVQS